VNISENYSIAIEAAIEASFKIMEFYLSDFSVIEKSDKSPVTEADLAAFDIIVSHLQKTNIPILGEEMVNLPYDVRKNWTENWCVDPLDGTKEFIKKNGEFAVNIALIKNQQAVMGIIASPVDKKILFGDLDLGVYLFDFEQVLQPESWQKLEIISTVNNPLIHISSRSHHSGNGKILISSLEKKFGNISCLQKGSSLKFFDLAQNKADIYPRFAPTMEWDIAPGQAILEALGGEIIDAKTGEKLKYNKENLLNPHFIAKTFAFLKS
jgi:3'(2'), 5'-bisphosphate nucleotidase